jgi:hypothetical protein
MRWSKSVCVCSVTVAFVADRLLHQTVFCELSIAVLRSLVEDEGARFPGIAESWFMSISKKLSIIPALALLVALADGCASGPSIRSQTDPAADFSKYRTFAFLDEVASDKAAYETFASQYLKTAIAREMQARGFQKAGADADLLVNFHVLTKDKVSVSQTPGGYYVYRRGYYGWGAGGTTNVQNYTEGTLNIDVADRAQKKLLWEGVAVGRVKESARKNPQPAIDAVVAQVFEQFPKQS